MLRAGLRGKRLKPSDDDRRRLAVKAQALGREVLAQIASVATPATLLRWYLCLLFIHPRGKWDYSARRKQLGRPWVQDLCQKGGYLLPRPDGSRLHHPPVELSMIVIDELGDGPARGS